MSKPKPRPKPRTTPKTRPGWVDLDGATWVRASAVTSVLAENLPEPKSGGSLNITRVMVGGQDLGSPYRTQELLTAICRAEDEETKVRALYGRPPTQPAG